MIHVADSSKKSPFRPLYRAFYPDPANKSELRAEGASRFRAPGNRGWPLSVARPGRELGLFSCSIPPGFVINHNMPTINTTSDWLCSGAFRYTDRRIGKERTGPDRDERFHYFSMAPNWAIGSEKIMLLCIAGGHNLNAALAQPERIAPLRILRYLSWHRLPGFPGCTTSSRRDVVLGLPYLLWLTV